MPALRSAFINCRVRLACAALFVLAGLAGCGGGGSTDAASSTTTNSGSGSSGSSTSPTTGSGSGTTTPPTPGYAWVYNAGRLVWDSDWSDVTMNYASTATTCLTASACAQMPATTAYEYWQPYPFPVAGSPASNGVGFNTTGYNYLTLAIKPTTANFDAQIQFFVADATTVDISFGNLLLLSTSGYGPSTMVANQWNVYNIPLTAFGLAAGGQWIYKFMLQQQGETNPTVVYFDRVGFTVAPQT